MVQSWLAFAAQEREEWSSKKGAAYKCILFVHILALETRIFGLVLWCAHAANTISHLKTSAFTHLKHYYPLHFTKIRYTHVLKCYVWLRHAEQWILHKGKEQSSDLQSIPISLHTVLLGLATAWICPLSSVSFSSVKGVNPCWERQLLTSAQIFSLMTANASLKLKELEKDDQNSNMF